MAATFPASLSLPSSESKVSSAHPPSFLAVSATSYQLSSSFCSRRSSLFFRSSPSQTNVCTSLAPVFLVSAELNKAHQPLKVMISGAPASGKGTQCELIVKQHDVVHISAGDLLRAEVAAGSENGTKAKEYMTKGELVPNDIIVNMVKERLYQPDAQQKGWLLDGYPRSKLQADAIGSIGIRPDVFLLLEVPDDVLIDRVVGRRLDPVTGRIYHLKYSPPETKEIADRLIQRFDDTDYQAKLRLQTHSQNVEDVVATYKDVLRRIDGNRPKEEVFQTINDVLSKMSDSYAGFESLPSFVQHVFVA